MRGYGQTAPQVHNETTAASPSEDVGILGDSAAVSARLGIDPPDRAAVSDAQPSERLTMSVPVAGLGVDSDTSVSPLSCTVTPLSVVNLPAERFVAHHVIGEWFDAAPVLTGLGVTA